MQELKDFQRQLLTNRNELLPLLKEHFDSNKKGYSRLGLDNIFDNAVLEIPFSVWQNNNGCETIQNLKTETPQELFKSLRLALHNWFLTDNILNNMDGYYYQALSELGYYCYPTSEWRDLLKNPGEVASPVFPPENTDVSYSNELMKTIKQWLITSGNNIIYINGSSDPYSLFKIKPESSANSFLYVLKNKNHSQVYFENLDLQQREEVLNKVREWIK